MKRETNMKKTSEFIKFRLLDGKVQKRTIYVNENGKKFVYNQSHFWTLEDFCEGRDVIA